MSQSTATNADQPTIVYGSGRRPDAAIPRPGLNLQKGRVAVVVTDPQNDFLSPQGVSWSVVGRNVTDNNTVENIGRLFAASKEHDVPLFISPHYYYPQDHKWQFEGALERLMHDIKMFDRPNALDLTNFDGSGADWLEQYKPFINDGETVVTSPHKVYGPESNDLVLQLRKRGTDQVILAGMSANLCVESHLRELLEQGFEVAVVDRVALGDCSPRAPTDPYVPALEHTVPQIMASLPDEAWSASRGRDPRTQSTQGVVQLRSC